VITPLILPRARANGALPATVATMEERRRGWSKVSDEPLCARVVSLQLVILPRARANGALLATVATVEERRRGVVKDER
jgi:hypothetical protein